jgi:hypothetical protein
VLNPSSQRDPGLASSNLLVVPVDVPREWGNTSVEDPATSGRMVVFRRLFEVALTKQPVSESVGASEKL